MIVRATEAADRPGALAVVQAAFGVERDAGEEVGIVEATWRLGAAPGLDLVAEEDGEVVGHVLGAHGRVGDLPLVGLAPLAVRPTSQGRGVGSALVRAFLEAAEAAGEPGVVLLGSPAYYGRFGFEPAAGAGLTYAPAPGSPAFQLRRLAAWHPGEPGEYRYAWELGG